MDRRLEEISSVSSGSRGESPIGLSDAVRRTDEELLVDIGVDGMVAMIGDTDEGLYLVGLSEISGLVN